MKKLLQKLVEKLPARRVELVVLLKVEPLADELLETLLAQGPESNVWRGMDECARRCMARWEDEAQGDLEQMGLALVRSQALVEMRATMLSVFHNRLKREKS